jgi:hypothetical protein
MITIIKKPITNFIKSSHPYYKIFGDIDFIKKSIRYYDKNIINSDKIFQNMIEIKLTNSNYFMTKSFLLNSDVSVLEKIKNIYQTNKIEIYSSMFVQLYFQLEKNPITTNFIYHKYCVKPEIYSIYNHNIDNRLSTLYLHETFLCSKLYKQKIDTTYVDLIPIDNYNNFLGLTNNGFRIDNIMNWMHFIKSSTSNSIKENIKENKDKLMKFEKKYNPEQIMFNNTLRNEYHKYNYNIDELQNILNYFDVGCFDIFELKNNGNTYIINNYTNVVRKIE